MNSVQKLLLLPIVIILSLVAYPVIAEEKPAGLISTNLTPAEQAWITSHNTIRVGISPVFPPLKFIEAAEIKGIEPDYLKLLSEHTGIKFEMVVTDFSSMDAKVKSGELDMFISFFIPERLSFMLFTEPLFEFKQVFVARSDAPFISGFGTLKGKKIATVKGVKLYDKLLAPYPDIEKVPVDTMEEMFKAVSESKADVLISKTFYAGYVIYKYPTLRIAGVADLPSEPYLYAVRKDYPELVSIINKAIKSISNDHREAIIQKWFNVHIEYTPNWRDIIKRASVIVLFFAFMLGLSFIWNRRLKQEITERKQAEQKLKEAMNYIQTLFNTSPVGIVTYKSNGDAVSANNAMALIVGAPIENLLKQNFRHIDSWQNYGMLEAAERALMSGAEQRTEIYVQTTYGNKVYIDAIFLPFMFNETQHLMVIAMDITARKESEARLERSENMLRMLFKLSPVGMAMIDHDTGKFLEVNESLLRATGYTEEEFLELDFWQITPKEYQAQELEQIRELNETGHFGPNEKEYIRKDGSRYPISISGAVFTDLDNRSVVWGVIEDITGRKEAEEALLQAKAAAESLSITDGLTGVANRRHFDDMLSQEFARHARSGLELSLIMLDIDYFKSFNDNYGHVKGDECLKQIADVIADCTNRAADLCARYGGEEFACILPETDLKGAVKIAENIRRDIESLAILHKGSSISEHVTASLGVLSVKCSTDGSAVEMLSQVDSLLYLAKSSGRNKVVFV